MASLAITPTSRARPLLRIERQADSLLTKVLRSPPTPLQLLLDGSDPIKDREARYVLKDQIDPLMGRSKPRSKPRTRNASSRQDITLHRGEKAPNVEVLRTRGLVNDVIFGALAQTHGQQLPIEHLVAGMTCEEVFTIYSSNFAQAFQVLWHDALK